MPTKRLQAPNCADTAATAQPLGASLQVVVTQSELARILGVSERKLEHDRHRGEGIPFIKIGRRVVYALADVEGYLEANRFVSTAEVRRSRR